MKVTKDDIKNKLLQYLNNQLTLEQLVAWSEKMVQEAEYDEKDFGLIRDILSRLGVADVKAFGLTWDDCSKILSSLGYQIKVAVV